MSAQDDIDQGIQKIHDSVYVTGTKRTSTYKMGHTADGEYPLVKAFIDGGAEPAPWPKTLMGQGLSLVERGKRAIPSDDGGMPLPPPIAPYAPGPAVKRDFGGSIQAAINAVPNGSLIYIEPGTYSGPLDVSGKDNLRLIGLGGTGWNEQYGVVLKTSGPNQIILREHSGGASVKASGFEIEHVTFRDEFTGGTGIDVYNTNHWKVRHCSFQGRDDEAMGFDRGAIYAHQDQSMAADNAYSYVENVKWRTAGPAIVADFAFITVFGGANGGGPNCGFRLLGNTQGCFFYGGNSNHSGRMLLCEGGANTFDWGWEQYGADNPSTWTIEITDPGAWPMSGRGNIIRGRITDHPWGSGKHVKLGPGTNGNIVECHIFSDSPNIQDSGSGNIIRPIG